MIWKEIIIAKKAVKPSISNKHPLLINITNKKHIMKKYLISAASCQENNAVIVSANSIDDVIAMLRRGEVDLSGVMNDNCQFRDFDIENGCEVIVSYKRDIIDYFKKDFAAEEIASVEALITIYDFYVE